MSSLRSLTDGHEGKLVARLPLHWEFKVEKPLPRGWRYRGMEGPVPANSELAHEDPTGTNGWRPVRTDIYLQGQGVLADDNQSHLGHYWYRTTFQMEGDASSRRVNLMLPGMFNEAWLFVNGTMVAHRTFTEPWWHSDYRFDWDVDVSRHLRAGRNDVAVRGFNPHN
jgi:hypothetical protein